MLPLFAQAPPPEAPSLFALPHGSNELWIAIIATFVVSMAGFFVMSNLPAKARRPIVWTFTFAMGLFYVLLFLWPSPINRGDADLARDPIEGFGFWLADTQPRVADVSNILTAFLLGLGVFSVIRIHFTRLFKKQKDWQFSIVLLVSMVTYAVFGYWDWITKEFFDPEGRMLDESNWTFVQYARDLLFDGLLQQMDAVMFSMIAFFILSAAYRAFRIRSVEASVMMGSALILILSIMGAVDVPLASLIDQAVGSDPSHFLNNFKISEIATWFRNFVQVPALRALEFGVGLGALAMGLRLWLGLEKGGVN